MELKKLIAPNQRSSGLSCLNCANLACEYDLDAGGAGIYVCEKYPGHANLESFPFRRDMPCFELSFWFSVFAQGLPANDDASCEAAIENFARSLTLLGGRRPDLKLNPGPVIDN